MSNFMVDELMHYGTKRHSGRFPYGSGDNPYQHESWYKFLSDVDEKRNSDFEYTDKETGRTYTGDMAIAKSMGLTATEFRTKLAISTSTARAKEVELAKKLKAEGKSGTEIAKIMGYNNESSVRSLLNQDSEARMLSAQKTADFLRKQVDEKGMIDVGVGVERELNISREKLTQALYILEMEGYPIWKGGIPQVTNPGKQTNQKVLCVPGTQHKDIYEYDKVHSITEDFISPDGGETFMPRFQYPASLDSKRIDVVYGDEGAKKEGLIELRRGVPDTDLGDAHYAQVRIMVDGTHYIKGMAVYSDDLPDGVDVRINTKKSSDTPLKGPKNNSVLKPIKNDPDNPFGSLIKEGINDPEHGTKGGGQSYYIDSDGKKKLSVINKRAEEGDWMEWSDKLPSQFLAKQSMSLINRQLSISKSDKQAEFDEIMALNNPAVKKQRLKSFSDDCDAAAEHLKAAALPRQKYQVMLPLTTIKDQEIYAPNYKDGETVALVRYPHGGTFEIPILKVNNHNEEGKSAMGKLPKDAVGVSKAVADKLSGADFDGDTVMVIPCNNPGSSVHITATPSLTDDFDDILEYGGRPDGSFKKMRNTQNEMGVISNLIMDMTLKGATNEELARAVKHSMVVIDAEKHELDYKASEKDFGIKELKKKYQGRIDPETGKYREGAATLITRAKSEKDVLKTKGSPRIDPDTGKLYYPEDKIVIETYTDKNGKSKVRTKKSTQMRETDDAYTLSTGTLQENAYADYANYMKNLANEARKAMVNTKDVAYSPTAKATYAQEVSSLNAKLNLSLLNAPKERRAQAMANAEVAKKKKADPDLTTSEIKKISQKALVNARAKVGAKRYSFTVTDREWEAMQSGAVSANTLAKIVAHMDQEQLMTLSTPRKANEISGAKQAKIAAMAASGYTPSEIAAVVGVSTTTVHKYLS